MLKSLTNVLASRDSPVRPVATVRCLGRLQLPKQRQGAGQEDQLNDWYGAAQLDFTQMLALTIEADNYYGALNGQGEAAAELPGQPKSHSAAASHIALDEIWHCLDGMEAKDRFWRTGRRRTWDMADTVS
jgi:hypothetical protein